MADHMREQILDAIETLLTGLTTTGSRVTRLRSGVITLADLPGLNVAMGEEQSAGDRGQTVFNAIDVVLEVGIEARVSSAEGALDQLLNTIAAEVYAAMRGLSLTGVQHSYWFSSGSPEIITEAVTPIATQTITYIIEYRHSLADATVAG